MLTRRPGHFVAGRRYSARKFVPGRSDCDDRTSNEYRSFILMRTQSLFRLPGLLAIALTLTAAAYSQAVMVPVVCEQRPCRPVPRPVPLPNALPVKSINIDVKIDGQVATTHVDQIFRNDTQFTLEGTYFFPIPENASIIEFSIWENGKKLVGEVRSREEARRIYDEIVRRQRDPGLLEYAGRDLFQASIFPIPPNSDKRLELKYSQVLQADSGTVAYKYPLGTGRNIWQRQARENVNLGDGQKFGTISGKVEITSPTPIRNVYSPTHWIDVATKDQNARVSFETKSSDSDFQLYFTPSSDDLGVSLLTYREPGKDGYFLLQIAPRPDIAESELVNKDIVFVLDTSGSMADEGKMDKARQALLFGIRTLRPGDRFNVIGFAGEERSMERGLIEANDEGRKRGIEFVGKLSATGGTNINDALLTALKQFENTSRPKMLVFMTDGLPTVGVTNADQIVKNLASAKKVDVRIFPFGFGYDVNTALLDRIGSENGGVSDYVQPKEDLEIKVSNFFRRVSSPVLADVELDMGPVLTEFVYPRTLTDVFRGSQITLIGRYKNTNDLRNITLRLSGIMGSQKRSFAYTKMDFPVRAENNDFLPRLWASRRVGYLIEQIRLNGETKELRDEVTDLGTRYGLVTPYTSYLATDGEVRQLDRAAMSAAPPKTKMMQERSGSGAVQMSVQQNAMQSNVMVVADEDAKDRSNQVLLRNSNQNQFVANKNFVYQKGVWTDTEFDEKAKLTEVRVKFGSDEYFSLVRDKPAIVKYLAIGEQVVLVFEGRVYRVTN